jgi:hypothetical protein
VGSRGKKKEERGRGKKKEETKKKEEMTYHSLQQLFESVLLHNGKTISDFAISHSTILSLASTCSSFLNALLSVVSNSMSPLFSLSLSSPSHDLAIVSMSRKLKERQESKYRGSKRI